MDGAEGVGRGTKTWKQCLAKYMKDLDLTAKDVQDRTKWIDAIHRNRLIHARMENGRKIFSNSSRKSVSKEKVRE